MYRKYYYGRTRTWTRDYDVIMTSYVWPHDDDVILPVSRRHLLRIFCTRRSGFSYSKAVFTSRNPTGLASEQFSDRRGICFVLVQQFYLKGVFKSFLLINRRSRDGETHRKRCALGSLYSVNKGERIEPYVIMLLLKPVTGRAKASFLSRIVIDLDISYFGF